MSKGKMMPSYVNNPDKPYKWRVFWSYLPDWIISIFLWGIFYLCDKVDGYYRVFSVTDTSLAHPYAEHERVPVWLLAVLCGIVPLVIIIVIAGIQRSFWDAHNGILGLVLCLGISQSFTIFVKICAGRPRPDLFARCQLPGDLTANPVHGLTDWKVCQRTTHLQEGFRSFPSGHASFSWAGLWYLTLYVAAKFRALNRKGYTVKSWVLMAPVAGATLICVSRTMDYRHHATDVIAGAIVGILSAWWAYRQYYPPLAAPKSWRTYDPRVKNAETSIPLHAVHEREVSDSGMGLVGRTSHAVEQPYAQTTQYVSPPGTEYPPARAQDPYAPNGREYGQRLE